MTGFLPILSDRTPTGTEKSMYMILYNIYISSTSAGCTPIFAALTMKKAKLKYASENKTETARNFLYFSEVCFSESQNGCFLLISVGFLGSLTKSMSIATAMNAGISAMLK